MISSVFSHSESCSGLSLLSGKGSKGIEIKLGILQAHRHREQTCVCQGGWRCRMGGLGVRDKQIHTVIHRMNEQQGPIPKPREPIQRPVINLHEKECVCVYIYLNHYAVQHKLTLHCKSTILQ